MFTRRTSITLVVLLLGAVVGAAVVMRNAEAAGTRRMTVPAAAFVVGNDSWDYHNGGYFLRTNSGAYFLAPLSFPRDRVRIERVILRAFDNGGTNVCLELNRGQPGTATVVEMTEVCSEDASDEDPRTFATSAISPAWSGPWHGLYLRVSVPAGETTYRFYGATIEWTPQ